MDMFATDDGVAEWELALLPLRGVARLPALIPLAWHLRQRDSARAAALAEEALALLPYAGLEPEARSATTARLHLAQAEIRWLEGELDEASTIAMEAFEVLQGLGDHAGCADAHWLRAWICVDRGLHEERDHALALCVAEARQGGDEVRALTAEAVIARWAVLRELHSARERWAHHFDNIGPVPPGLNCWINDFHAMAASQSSDFGQSASLYIQSHEFALQTGQLRAAIIAATNTGEKFSHLNDHHAALEWMQRGLELARRSGWPRNIGACLMHTADTMRRLGRLDVADELLREGLGILRPFADARVFGIALQYRGDLCLERADYAGAFEAFQQLAGRAEALRQADFQMVARRGQAHALCFLDRAAEALAMAHQAVELSLSHRNIYNHIAALRVLALIHRMHPLRGPEGMTEPNASLHYLHRALDLVSTIEGYTVPGDLYDTLAAEYARLGDYKLAYEMAQAASKALEKTHSQEATSRAIAMQVHQKTEQARAEGQHHRELAMAEARRAEVLAQSGAMLQRLSAIGQEITTHLDAEAVYQVLNRHVHELLSANTFSVYLIDGERLNRAFGVEGGLPLPPNSVALDHPQAWSARCVRERREVYVDNAAFERAVLLTPGTSPSVSALFVPLLLGERVLGVMTVQAMHAGAYGERERLIFRTLCAYGAIALDNASAYRQLQEAQSQLVSQEKLAALGALMAGVAHELNTPIGNSLLIASTMEQKTNELERSLNGPGLRRSDLAAFIADTRKASELVMRGLHSAADLVSSFKQVAVDRTTEQRRRFDLHQVAHEIVATMMNRIRAAGHRIEYEIPEGVSLDSYPGPFGQVVTNLINNALLHAFERREGGRMRLTANLHIEGRVLVAFSDDGSGIAPEHLSRIFDPFFTTRLGRGGSGLGLSISYNIVTSLLGGQISVVSSKGGTTFTLDLPTTAPTQDPSRHAAIYR
ncbi:ATP-binding protein [Massilia endophytica]|uniref:ATP-binding protein n=1 Tax=Massilia endophytica TaxID=2899220 RepID=UPI001E312BF0|nr:ATP-binding protein [Massilia endophytica]UGQ47749.1 ATP-binding protein [Massilia endophytica]